MPNPSRLGTASLPIFEAYPAYIRMNGYIEGAGAVIHPADTQVPHLPSVYHAFINGVPHIVFEHEIERIGS